MKHLSKHTMLVIGLIVLGIALGIVTAVVMGSGGNAVIDDLLSPSVPPGIVFARYNREEVVSDDLYRISMNDHKPIPLHVKIPAGSVGGGFAVSPDGQTIIFTNPIGRNLIGFLYRIHTNGRVQRMLDTPQTLRGIWSPDGEWIAYTTSSGSTSTGYEICLMHLDGSDKRCPTEPHLYVTYQNIAWSPNGRWISFAHGTAIGVIDVDTSHLEFLADNATTTFWSPDSEWIVFSLVNSEEIFRIRPDGTGLESLGAVGRYPVWSPDGAYIAFFGHQDEHWSLNLLSLADRSVRVLHAFDESQSSSFFYLSYPSWSPNGGWIGYTNSFKLFLVPIDGGQILTRDELMTNFSWIPPVCPGECDDVAYDPRHWSALQDFHTPTPFVNPTRPPLATGTP